MEVIDPRTLFTSEVGFLISFSYLLTYGTIQINWLSICSLMAQFCSLFRLCRRYDSRLLWKIQSNFWMITRKAWPTLRIHRIKIYGKLNELSRYVDSKILIYINRMLVLYISKMENVFIKLNYRLSFIPTPEKRFSCPLGCQVNSFRNVFQSNTAYFVGQFTRYKSGKELKHLYI